MAGLSPVLEAYFRGQQQQSGLIKDAREVQDASERRKQQQQQIDELISQHKIENDHAMKVLGLQNDIHKLNLQKTNMEAVKEISEQLASSKLPIQSNIYGTQSENVNIPGLPATPPSTAPVGNGGPPDIGTAAIPGLQIPGVTMPGMQPNPTQTVRSPLDGSPITVPTPTTDLQRAADQAKALLPIHVAEEQAKSKVNLDNAVELFKTTQEPKYLAQIDSANRRADDANQRARDIAEMRGKYGEAIGEMRANQHLNDLTGGLIGAPLAEHVDAAVQGAATGHYDVKNEPYPKIKEAIRSNMLAKGLNPDVPDKVFNSIYSIANGAVDIKNTIDSMNTALNTPKNLTGRISDLLSGGAGYKGLGVDKATYDTFAARLTPALEIASGMSPGSMRSVALLDMFKRLVRQPGNSAKDIAVKDYEAIAIPMVAVSKQMSQLPKEQRKLVWGQVVKDNPRLMTMHPEVARSLAGAVQTGDFEPGKDLKTFLEGLKNGK